MDNILESEYWDLSMYLQERGQVRDYNRLNIEDFDSSSIEKVSSDKLKELREWVKSGRFFWGWMEKGFRERLVELGVLLHLKGVEMYTSDDTYVMPKKVRQFLGR